MAIKSISFEGFKSLVKTTLNFGPKENYIEAANGVGKSSVADAISFIYCGSDRFGNVKPIHLINKDMDKMKVVLTTDTGGEYIAPYKSRISFTKSR